MEEQLVETWEIHDRIHRYLLDAIPDGALTASLATEGPAALKYALSLLGLMSPNTRLPMVELDDTAKREVAAAIVVALSTRNAVTAP